MKIKLIVAGLAVGVAAFTLLAQEDPGQRQGPRGGGPRGGPLMEALDTNKDGELDATELTNATASLKKLDKNSDGKLSGDEIRPQRPGGPGGPGGQGRPSRPPGGAQ